MSTDNISSESTTPTENRNQPKVSIVVPVYNAGEHLRPCLDSLVNQTLREIEIICVLDCPTDGSDKVVEEYAAKDSRIVVIRNEQNLHIGESRNMGIRAAHGEYIGFSDHDDTHALDMYEKLYQQTSNCSKDLVLSGSLAQVLSQKRNPKTVDIAIEWAMAIFLQRSWPVTSHLYKKHFLSSNNIFFDDTKQLNREDALFNLRAACKIQKTNSIATINAEFYNRILHNNNTSANPDHRSSQKTVCFLSKIHDLLRNGQSILPPNICDYGMSQLTVRSMYTLFRDELKANGFNQSLNRIEQAFNSNPFLMDTLKKTSIFIPHTPPTKCLFIMLLKLRLNHSSTGVGR